MCSSDLGGSESNGDMGLDAEAIKKEAQPGEGYIYIGQHADLTVDELGDECHVIANLTPHGD